MSVYGHYRRTILMGEGHRAHRLCRLQRGSHRLPGVAFVPVQLYGVAIGQRRIAHPADIRQGGMLGLGYCRILPQVQRRGIGEIDLQLHNPVGQGCHIMNHQTGIGTVGKSQSAVAQPTVPFGPADGRAALGIG